jgi:hypothetical protein
MKPYRSFRRGAAAIAILLAVACAHREPTLPHARHEISASVDGAPWSANLALHQPVAELQQVYDGPRLHLRGQQVAYDGVARDIEIIIADYAGTGAYTLGTPESGRWALYRRRPWPSVEPVTYFTREHGGGTVTVTSVDPVTGTLEGEFSFTAQLPSGATVTVARGRFSGSYEAL